VQVDDLVHQQSDSQTSWVEPQCALLRSIRSTGEIKALLGGE